MRPRVIPSALSRQQSSTEYTHIVMKLTVAEHLDQLVWFIHDVRWCHGVLAIRPDLRSRKLTQEVVDRSSSSSFST